MEFRRVLFRSREAVKVHRAGLKTRQHLFDDALHVVEFDWARGMLRALLCERPNRAKSKGGALVYLLGGAAEDGAQLEKAYIADVAVQVAGNHRRSEEHT